VEKRVVFRSKWLPYALVFPQLLITVVFFFWPASQAVIQSMQQQDPFGINVDFVGLDNFVALLHDEHYLSSFRITAIFSTLVTVSGMVIALTLAVYADRALRLAGLYKTLLIWPYAVAHAVAAVLWLFLFNPTLGIVAHWIKGFGIGWDPLLDAQDAMTLIVVAAVWNQISYNFLFFLAGLQSIPKSLIEAAAIDGAGPGRRFWDIAFPLLSPTGFFLLVVNIIYAFFGTFGVVASLTQGGPGQATNILVYKVWNDGFRGQDLGGSAAQSAILMVVVILATVIQFRFIERRVHY